jgi:primosomal protein N' (replication factor Y)
LPALDSKTYQPFLLHGVTGSGKTELYLRGVEHLLAKGRGSLVLVPEIALTPQLVGRFRSRFGAEVAVLHSGLKDKERLLYWQALRRGELRVAVGVRSAVFAPVRDLGLIVVDEEHDPSFKQEEKLRYQARDLAVVRGNQLGATVLLGSATPSLETLENARRGRYRTLLLGARVDDRPMPTVELVDLREERPRPPVQLQEEEAPILSAQLLLAMAEVLEAGRQVILFLNRRGHSTLLLCATCGQALRCHQCDVSLTQHLLGKSVKVMCHYCGEARGSVERCDACQGPLLKLGVGTQRVEAEVAARFPKARVGRLDRDFATSAEKVTELLAAFARREVDVLVGTQMVAKGHDFPGVTLVCVVMADTSLGLPDFRASERTFQLLTQVAGRAGRGQEKGRVLIQTYNPDAEAVQRAVGHDYGGFAEQELVWRQRLAYPPFNRLAAVRIEGEDGPAVQGVAARLGERLAARLPPSASGVRLLGPAPAPIAKLRGKTRWQLLLKAGTHRQLTPLLDLVDAEAARLPRSVRVTVDVDPGAML